MKLAFTCLAVRLLVSLLLLLSLVGRSSGQTTMQDPPQLNGDHFRITVLEESGFLNVHENIENIGGNKKMHLSYSGYLIKLIESLARPDRANFTYDLLPPSGIGSLCLPRLDADRDRDSAYDKSYRTQYNCGASDTNDLPLIANYSTDMYLGMYYVTPGRQ